MTENKKIKVLFRLRSMEMGGVQKVLINLLHNLDRNKFDISLLLNLKQGVSLEEVPSDVKIFNLAKGKEKMSSNTYIRLFQLVLRRARLMVFDKFPFLIRKLVLKQKYDVDIAFIDSLIPDLLRTSSADKKIGWIHGDLSKSVYTLEKKQKIVKGIGLLDKAIYVSKHTLEAARSLRKEVSDNAEIIYNPFNVEDIIEKSKVYISESQISSVEKEGVMSFVFVGRVYETKGCYFLLNAHKSLLSKGVYHKIYIVGEGAYSAKMESLVKKYGIGDSFILLGEKKNPYPYIAQSDVFILPSFSEGYPLSLVEALILGKPVITTNVGGISEIVTDGENGIFIDYSQEGVEKGIFKFIEDGEMFKRMKQRNKDEKRRFDTKTIYRQIEKIIEK